MVSLQYCVNSFRELHKTQKAPLYHPWANWSC
jgi:hypothetical protein